ncbi:MAG: DEAD/DEAH box helicase [Nanoarchaeota archaeon]|nr:DEAD/DEAH box helicase [Nanoarchaeota archaeon]
MEQFEKLGLCEHVLKVISNKKFTEPSEIQKKTIPLILEGKDVIAGSATGSGKTLAFGAGMIKNVVKGRGVQGLILTPTRELCEQVAGALEEFAYYKGLEVASVYGGVSMVHQTKKLVYADIVVATPGRLLDHMRHNSINLSKVDYLVLDEADRMWDMGFKDDVGDIVKACPSKRQTLLFSATISGDLADFSKRYMKSPVEIAVEHYVDTSLLKQVYYDVRDGEKFSLLVHLLKYENAPLVMIFCNTRRNVDFVASNLRLNGVNAQAIHGGMEQNKRQRVMGNFRNAPLQNAGVIVCTDVAARGLDIVGVSHVYNYDLPADARDYIHRIGRTARAGASGEAVNILASRDYDNFSNIMRRNEGLVVKRGMTPKFERVRISVVGGRGVGGSGWGRSGVGGRKSEARSRGRGGKTENRNQKIENRDRGSVSRGLHGRAARSSSGRRTGSGKPVVGSRMERRSGERNKRSSGVRSSGVSGFRGGGRNTRASVAKRG